MYKLHIVPFSSAFLIQPQIENSHFLNAIQDLVDSMIPESIWLEMKSAPNPEPLYSRLRTLLPLFRCSELNEASQSLTVTYLCPSEYTHYARRYVIDTLAKSLLPGKTVEIVGGLSLSFQFESTSPYKFLIAQEIIAIHNAEENLAIRKNLPNLIAELKQKLPSEFLRQSESVVHRTFMPRNEEEMIRNLIVLSTQIKYVRDLPQVSIHYEKQTDRGLSFTVIIARLLKGSVEPLRKILDKSSLKMDIDDIRIMGYLKQKYPKESAILRVTLDKRPFFRSDYSVDLLRARQKIVLELGHCLGSFRDFNGGMILKQDEALTQLRQELSPLSHEMEFLLENYFYSLKPGFMQTIHETSVLKKHFELLNELLSFHSKPNSYEVRAEFFGKFFLCFISAASASFKEEVLRAIAPLEISSRNLTTVSLEIKETNIMGFILRVECPHLAQKFQTALFQVFQR